MKTLTQNVVFLLLLLFLSSCAKIYESPNALARTNDHKTIAIVPPKVSIAAQKKVDAEAIIEQQKTESLNFQQEIYSWLLKRKKQGKISVEIQDVQTTNAKLRKAGYFDEPALSPAEIANLLGVDGVITSNFGLTKPMSTGGAIALGALFGVSARTNSTTVSMDIHDRQTEKMIWNYNHKYSGSVGSTPTSLVDALMRHASKKMPYTK